MAVSIWELISVASVSSLPVETVDKVQIVKSQYNQARSKLIVEANSDASPNSVTMSAWAEYNNKTVDLGELRFNKRKNKYTKSIKKIRTKPDRITVKSSKGGSDSRECSTQ